VISLFAQGLLFTGVLILIAALPDPLTGAFNRRYLDRRLIEEVSRARRYALPLSIMMLDIDHFKQIDDRHGHQAGDQVLSSFGRVVNREIRALDILARYGGEEFLVVAPQTPFSRAADIAERLCKCIESHRFNLPDDRSGVREIIVTVSIGMASLGDGLDSVEQLIQAADANLYRAKREGRNRVIARMPDVVRNSAPRRGTPWHVR